MVTSVYIKFPYSHYADKKNSYGLVLVIIILTTGVTTGFIYFILLPLLLQVIAVITNVHGVTLANTDIYQVVVIMYSNVT